MKSLYIKAPQPCLSKNITILNTYNRCLLDGCGFSIQGGLKNRSFQRYGESLLETHNHSCASQGARMYSQLGGQAISLCFLQGPCGFLSLPGRILGIILLQVLFSYFQICLAIPETIIALAY